MRDLFIIMIISLLIFFMGIFIGLYIGKVLSENYSKKKHAGIFHINTTDPEKDVIQIELSIPVGELIGKKEVIFKVMDESQ